MAGREGALTAALVRLVDTLVADYDPVELTQELVDATVQLLHADAAGLMLADGNGTLQVFASTSEQTRLLELLQIQSATGPCLQAYKTGEQVLIDDFDTIAPRWPTFVEHARRQGFTTVCALPMRLRSERLGALNLFLTEGHTLDVDELRVAQALADFATIGILHARILADSLTVNEQLTVALNSRVVIEQAKGMLAEYGGLDMDAVFQRMRDYARTHNHLLAEIARAVVQREIAMSDIVDRQPRT